MLAGGTGHRLRPLTDTSPSAWSPIAGRPLLAYWVDPLATPASRGTGQHHAHADQVRAYIDGSRLGRASARRVVSSRNCSARPGRSRPTPTWPTGPRRDHHRTPTTSATSTWGGCSRSTESHGDPFTMLLFRAPIPPILRDRRVGRRGAGRLVRREAAGAAGATWPTAAVYIVDADAYREIAAMRAFDLGFEVLPRVRRPDARVGVGRDITSTSGTHEALAEGPADAPRLLAGPAGGAAGTAARDIPRPRRHRDRAGALSRPTRPRSACCPARGRALRAAAARPATRWSWSRTSRRSAGGCSPSEQYACSQRTRCGSPARRRRGGRSTVSITVPTCRRPATD